MSKFIAALAVAYLVIDGIVFASQFFLARFFDPVCIGSKQHVLLDRYFPPRNQLDELDKTRTGKRDITDRSLLLRLGLHVARWFPGPVPGSLQRHDECPRLFLRRVCVQLPDRPILT